MKFDTILVRGGYDAKNPPRTIAEPIYQTAAYYFDDATYAKELFALQKEGFIYTRLGNPTLDIFEKRMAMLDDGVGALTTSSGSSAIMLAIQNIAVAGDEIVSASSLYGGTYNMFSNTFKKFGIKVTLVDVDNLEQIKNAVTPKTKAIFAESIGNPNANIPEFEKIASIAHNAQIPLIIDNTFATPYLFKSKDYGADIVVYSTTKYINGHGNSIGGMVVDLGTFDWTQGKFQEMCTPDASYHGVVFTDAFKNAAYILKMRTQLMRDLGPCASPFNTFLTMQGMETLSLRMERHVANANKIAEFLSKHKYVTFVNYPGLKTDKYYERQQKYMPKGAGSVFTFGVKGGRSTGEKFINELKLFLHVANVGDARSMIIHPGSTTHSQLSDEQLLSAGISNETVRISVGLEDWEDLIADLDCALEASQK